MEPVIVKADLVEIADLRKKFLAGANIEFILDKAHLYGWADHYLFTVDGTKAGYGCVWGKDDRKDRDTVFEFYLEADYRAESNLFFSSFLSVSKVKFIEAQSNDPFLAPMFFEYASDVNAESVLFEEGFESKLSIPGAKLEAKQDPEASKFDKQFVLTYNGEPVGSGGLMLNYNFPYADIYYGVEEQHRRKGFGSFIVQELKKAAYDIGRVPAARCNINNPVSKRTMMKAGLKPCGWRLGGKVKNS